MESTHHRGVGVVPMATHGGAWFLHLGEWGWGRPGYGELPARTGLGGGLLLADFSKHRSPLGEGLAGGNDVAKQDIRARDRQQSRWGVPKDIGDGLATNPYERPGAKIGIYLFLAPRPNCFPRSAKNFVCHANFFAPPPSWEKLSMSQNFHPYVAERFAPCVCKFCLIWIQKSGVMTLNK